MDFTGDPFHSGEFLRALKRGRRDAGPKNAGQECQTQNTTRYSLGTDTFTMAERKEKCTLLYQQLFQCYGNAQLKRRIVCFVSLVVKFCDQGCSLPVCVCVMSAYLLGNCIGECVQTTICPPIGMPPIVTLEAALSN